ncbi:MAG: hypothetical protein Ct9H300mP16_18810 [Pseudomonadota bacterium]|nr:MAG: hypothetical protein Ct9H300mP16_18810 [Pseudomonadota bacterium]
MGDTALTPYSTGTWGSRSMVMSGGAVANACDENGQTGVAHRCYPPAVFSQDAVVLRDGAVQSADRSISLAEIARTWYLKPQDLG